MFYSSVHYFPFLFPSPVSFLFSTDSLCHRFPDPLPDTHSRHYVSVCQKPGLQPAFHGCPGWNAKQPAEQRRYIKL